MLSADRFLLGVSSSSDSSNEDLDDSDEERAYAATNDDELTEVAQGRAPPCSFGGACVN